MSARKKATKTPKRPRLSTLAHDGCDGPPAKIRIPSRTAPLSRLLIGMRNCDPNDIDFFTAYLGAAEPLVEDLIQEGMFDCQLLEKTVEAVVESHETLGQLHGPTYKQQLDALKDSDARLLVAGRSKSVSDAVCTMRFSEAQAAFSLGLLLGLHVGGGR